MKAGTIGLFLDRDGTINVDLDYISNPDDLKIIPGSAEAIREANNLGLKVFVISNQSGVARGLYREADVAAIHRRLVEILEASGARIDSIYYCPHHPDYGIPPYRKVCGCRKPNTGMLLQAKKEHGINLASSFVVGDKFTDIQAGKNAGCHTVLVLTGHGVSELEQNRNLTPPDHVANDLLGGWNYIRKSIEQR